MSGEVLFFDFAFQEYLGIIEESAARGIRPIMNQPPMRQALSARGVHARPFAEFATREDSEFSKTRSVAMGKQFASTLASSDAASAFNLGDGNLLVGGGSELVKTMLSMAENQIFVARIMERLIQSTDLRAVVMRSCLSSGQRTLQSVAARHGVPVLELSHGNPAWGADLAPPAYNWHFAVFGEREQAALTEMGARPDMVHPTGAPHWDGLYRPENRLTREDARRAIGLESDRPLILLSGGFVSGGTPFFADTARMHMKANRAFAEAVAGLSPRPLVAVRPHPGESRQKPGRRPTPAEMSDYRNWFASMGAELIHIDYSDTSLVSEKACLIRASDVVVVPGVASTLVTEVMILDRPVVLLETESTPFKRFYRPEDGVLSASNGRQLAEILDRLLLDPGHRRNISDAMADALPALNRGHDGEATGRVVDLIQKIARD